MNESKYTNWYNNIISNAKLQLRIKGKRYYERHHITPRSLGGNNTKENIVLLTAREHYVCHLLLPKMCEGEDRAKMVYAFMRISGALNQYRKPYAYTGRLYEKMKKSYSKHISGKNSYMYGIPKTKEQRSKISETRKRTGVARGENNPMYGRKHSKESIKKMSLVKKQNMTDEKRRKMINDNPRSKSVVCHKGQTFPSLSEVGRYYGFVGLTAPRRRISTGEWKFI